MHQTDVSVVDLMRACMAAPTYFSPVQIDGETYMDGSLGGSNPSSFAVREAKMLWDIDPDDIGVFVSLGCGTRRPHRLGSGPLSSISLAKALVHSVTESESTHEELASLFMRGRNSGAYYRFNVGESLGDIDIDEVQKVEEITAITRAYASRTSIRTQIWSCAQSLSSRYVAIWINSANENETRIRSTQIGSILRAREGRIEERLAENTRQRDKLLVELAETRSLFGRWEAWEAAQQQENKET